MNTSLRHRVEKRSATSVSSIAICMESRQNHESKMKTLFRKIIPRMLLLAMMAGLVSCASPVERRITRNPQIYSALSEHDKGLVAQGKIQEGMSKQAVFISWGPPARIAEGTRKGQKYERWSYVGYDSVVRSGYGFGYGGWRGRYGYYCDVYDPFFYGGPVVDYIPYEAGVVEFVNGQVSAWSAPR